MGEVKSIFISITGISWNPTPDVICSPPVSYPDRTCLSVDPYLSFVVFSTPEVWYNLPLLFGASPIACLYSFRPPVNVASIFHFLPQVTVYGSWKFFSTLSVPLCVKLTDGDREGSLSPLTPSISSPCPVSPSLPTGSGIEKTLVCQPGGNSPSILSPHREIGGTVLKLEGERPDMEWSNVYPLPCEEGWNKPHLLVEVC